MSIEKQTIEKLKEAYKIMKMASMQSHYGHFDREGTHGRNCPECIRADNLRDQADKIFKTATSLYRKSQC